MAGLRYFNIIKEKLKERGANYKVLYAFSDFVHPETNAAISEHAVNELKDGELIEERFEGDDYRLMVVANKFQTGFDQPLLAGMFLDKPVVDRNAVQTVSRLNRCHEGKKDVVVVDFTNNAAADPQGVRRNTAKARRSSRKNRTRTFARNSTPRFWRRECSRRRMPPISSKLLATGTDAQVQFFVNALRTRFQAKIADAEERKAFVYLLARFVKSFPFPDLLLHLCAGD